MKLLNVAHKLSFTGSHSNKKFRMAAVVAKGGAVLSVGANIRDHHAEMRALRPHRCFEGATIYVARTTGGVSRPCDDCMRLIRNAGLSYIVYFNSLRETVKERVLRMA